MGHTGLFGILRRLVCFTGATSALTVTLKANFKNADGNSDVREFNHELYQNSTGNPKVIPNSVALSENRIGCTTHRRNIIFIRHGQYETGAKNREDKVLTDLGWRQAYATGSHLRKLGIKIDYLIHSDLIRARQTTAALLTGLCSGNDDLEETLGDDNDVFNLPVLVNLASSEQYGNAGDYSLTASSWSTEGDHRTSASGTDSTPTSLGMANQSMGSAYKPFRSAEFLCQQSRLLAEGAPPARPEPRVGRPRSDEQIRIDGARLDAGYDIHLQQNTGLTVSKTWSTVIADTSRSSDTIPPLPPPIGTNQVTEDTVIFVGHANVFRYWLCRLLELPPEAWLRFSIYHGSITSLVLHYDCTVPSTRSRFWQLPRKLFNQSEGAQVSVTAVRVGEVGHLPVNLLTR